MKVKDLIAQLKEQDPEAEVISPHYDRESYVEVVGVAPTTMWKKDDPGLFEGAYHQLTGDYATKQQSVDCVEIL